jgi:hypothetical protein
MENKLSIYVLSDLLSKHLILKRFANQDNRWMAEFENCEVKDSKDTCIISSCYGNGTSPEEAILDYISNIAGKILVFNAFSENRKEFYCPTYLTN